MKKYSRKNNKKFKCSKKLMKGGSFESSFKMSRSMKKRKQRISNNFFSKGNRISVNQRLQYVTPHTKKKL